jgi:hypothetical protein
MNMDEIKTYQRLTIGAFIVAVLSLFIAIAGALPVEMTPAPTAAPMAFPTVERGGLPLQPRQAFRSLYARDAIDNAGTLTNDGAAVFGSTMQVTGTTTLSNVTATTITTTNLVSQTVGNSTTYLTSTNASLTNATIGAGSATTLASGYLTSTNVISMGGATFTGAIKYGTAANYTTGASITHGFSTTPTICILTPARDVTATLTITTTGFSSTTATRADGIFWLCGK